MVSSDQITSEFIASAAQDSQQLIALLALYEHAITREQLVDAVDSYLRQPSLTVLGHLIEKGHLDASYPTEIVRRLQAADRDSAQTKTTFTPERSLISYQEIAGKQSNSSQSTDNVTGDGLSMSQPVQVEHWHDESYEVGMSPQSHAPNTDPYHVSEFNLGGWLLQLAGAAEDWLFYRTRGIVSLRVAVLSCFFVLLAFAIYFSGVFSGSSPLASSTELQGAESGSRQKVELAGVDEIATGSDETRDGEVSNSKALDESSASYRRLDNSLIRPLQQIKAAADAGDWDTAYRRMREHESSNAEVVRRSVLWQQVAVMVELRVDDANSREMAWNRLIASKAGDLVWNLLFAKWLVQSHTSERQTLGTRDLTELKSTHPRWADWFAARDGRYQSVIERLDGESVVPGERLPNKFFLAICQIHAGKRSAAVKRLDETVELMRSWTASKEQNLAVWVQNRAIDELRGPVEQLYSKVRIPQVTRTAKRSEAGD